MTVRKQEADGAGDRPLRLLPPRLVPLSADEERRAVDALAGLLAAFLERRDDLSPPTGQDERDASPRPGDPEAA